MTKPNGWTGGPWIVGTHQFDNDGYAESIIKQADGPVYVAVAVTTGPNETDQRKSNARLIAAAPSLYEALAEAVEWMGYAMDTNLEFGLGEAPLAKARAALSAVEGGV